MGNKVRHPSKSCQGAKKTKGIVDFGIKKNNYIT